MCNTFILCFDLTPSFNLCSPHIVYYVCIYTMMCFTTTTEIHNPFNRVTMECDVPSIWKAAVVNLIPKSAAKTDPSLPGKFCPIALTPAISKLFSSILRDRWLRHILVYMYLNCNIQKAFLPRVSGMSKQQAKFTAFIKTAKHLRKSLAVAWLDIANAGSKVVLSSTNWATAVGPKQRI